jgi:hypothetical protein
MIYNDEQKRKFNNESPGNQLAQIGSHVKELEDYAPAFLYKGIIADATAGIDVFDSDGAPFQLEIIDIIVQARATSASGTVKLTDGTNDISDAIIMATDKAMTKAGTLDDAYTLIDAGGALKLVTNGATDRGLVTIVGRKLS